MMRPLLFLLFLGTVSLLSAQVQWIDDEQRSLQFPSSQYFVGFIRLTQISSYEAEELDDKLKENARAALSESVLVSIKSQSSNEQVNSNNYSKDLFQRLTVSSSSIEVSGIEYRTHVDESSDAAFAVAYVKKSNVVTTYNDLIQEKFAKVDNALKIADQFREKGDVKTELRIYYRLLPYIKEIESSVFVLNASGGALTDEVEVKLRSLRLSVTEKISGVLNDSYDIKNGAKLISAIFKDQIEEKSIQINMTALLFEGEAGTTEFSDLFQKIQAEELRKAGFTLTTRNSLYRYVGNYWNYDKDVLTLSVSIINRRTQEYLASVDVKIDKAYLEENEINYVP